MIEEIFILSIWTSHDFSNHKRDISEGRVDEKSNQFSHNICVAKEEEHWVGQEEEEERNHPKRKEVPY